MTAFEGMVLGVQKDQYLVRLVDLIHDDPDTLSVMSREAFPKEHPLEAGALFVWTIDQGHSNVLVFDAKV